MVNVAVAPVARLVAAYPPVVTFDSGRKIGKTCPKSNEFRTTFCVKVTFMYANEELLLSV
jgi:hypothetical protein